MDDLPGCFVAMTRTCITKLEDFEEIRLCGKRNFKEEFLHMAFQLLEEIFFINEIGTSNF